MSWSRRLAVGVGALALVAGVVPVHAGVSQSGVVSADPVDWTPDVEDGKVNATATVGDTTVAVGEFTTVRERGAAATMTRTNIFAFDSSGEVSDTFTPDVGTSEVFDVVSAGDGRSVYIGGVFRNVNGERRTARVARVDLETGEVVTSFRSPNFNRKVNSLHLENGRLYVGGWFTRVGGQPHTSLVALNPETGANTGHLDLTFSDTWNGGRLGIDEFTMTPDGSKLVAIGNFRNVEGQTRNQIVLVDTDRDVATLNSWATSRYSTTCHPRFDTYMWGVDFAPDGSYFVAVTTGAFSGGVNSGTLCDTAARWETDRTGAGQQPTWVDYMGGDTLTEVEVTDQAVYIGGHFRWANNPYAGDRVGPGAVRRMGIAALDTRNGLPLSWNPGRARGWGVWGFESTADGLWVGHDTDRIGNEHRAGVALLPLLGGSTLPPENTGSLPGDAYLLGERPTLTGPSPVLYRVNAGGPELPSSDEYIGWSADTQALPSAYRNGGSNTASWSTPVARAAALPASVPTDLFATERWDPGSAPEMSWDFPVEAGLPLQVRVYLASSCSCTNDPGERQFDVSLDGTVVLDDHDMVADTGHQTGTVKTFDITSDGNVDIDFGHVVENPLVNGIEIVRTDLAPPSEGSDDVVHNQLTDSGATGSATVDNGGVDWSSVRGAFMVDGVLYNGWADGTMTWRNYDGSRFGRERSVDLNGLTTFASELSAVRGMWYDRDSGRLYFTLNGQNALFYRYFTPDSQTVGAVRFQVSNNGTVDWRTVSGGFLAQGRLYTSHADGTLTSVQWEDGPVAGTVEEESGPASDGVSWSSRALFLYAG